MNEPKTAWDIEGLASPGALEEEIAEASVTARTIEAIRREAQVEALRWAKQQYYGIPRARYVPELDAAIARLQAGGQLEEGSDERRQFP